MDTVDVCVIVATLFYIVFLLFVLWHDTDLLLARRVKLFFMYRSKGWHWKQALLEAKKRTT
jgi:hypothetical protein